MAKYYYYKRYEVIEEGYIEGEWSQYIRYKTYPQSTYAQAPISRDWHYGTDYEFRDGSFHVLNTKEYYEGDFLPPGVLFKWGYTLYQIGSSTFEQGGQTYYETREKEREMKYVRGSYINTLKAGEGTYPIDGRHSDGYWYVRGAAVNNAPTTPPSITIPTTIKSGESFTITWGASTDADGDSITYRLERQINGGTWTQVYSVSSRSKSEVAQSSWNTVAYRVRAYDGKEYSNYRTSPTRTVIHNTPPTISGQDQDLGDKNLGFLITYQVNDVDTEDSLIVTEKLNGSIIRTINGAPRNQNLEIEITNEKLFSLPLNSDNTIEVKVDDQNGGIAYRRYTFRRTNTAPIISGQDENLGQKLEPFSIDFSVSDNEGNAIIVKTYLNNILKEEYQAENETTNTFTISKEDWFKLPIGQHSIKIEATDEHGATAIRNYTFERYDDKIQFTFKNPIETDIMATKILVTPTWYIPEGAIAIVEACNNGFDEEPTWEDITSQVLINRHYNFTNGTKTGDKWGINIRFTIEKGTATGQAIVNGFGGAFE